MNYQTCSPVQGADGKWYVAGDYSDRVDVFHADFERERGNLREVIKVREIEEENEIQPGDLVCLGYRVTVWNEIAA